MSFNLFRLRILNLSSNFLTELPDAIGNLSELVQLRLCNNQLTALPIALRHLQRLQVLKFMAFELVEKSSYSFQVLDISSNLFSSFPEDILCHLLGLCSLTLNFCLLESLPADLGCCSSLISLEAQDNCLDHLPSSMGNLSSLMILAWMVGESFTRQIRRFPSPLFRV